MDPEPYTLRPNEEEPALWSARPCAALYRKFAPVALHSRVFPGAVVVAHQKAFCCFYHGWGNREDGLAFTPQMGPGLVMPRVCADDVYRRRGPLCAHPANTRLTRPYHFCEVRAGLITYYLFYPFFVHAQTADQLVPAVPLRILISYSYAYSYILFLFISLLCY